MRDEINKQKAFSRRSFIISGIKLLLLTTVLGRYYYLQISKSEKYSVLSENNRFKLITIPALRGKMIDSEGVDIVSNSTYFRLVISTFKAKQYKELIPKIEEVLGRKVRITDEVVRKRLLRKFKNDPLTLEDNLDWESMSRIAANLNDLDGVDIIETISRKYYNPEAFSTFCGYISSPTPQEVEKYNLPSFSDVKIGKAGLEKKFDSTLRGEIGYRKIEVDVGGNVIRELLSKEPIKGSDLELNVNANLQIFIHEMMKERQLNGAVIVMEAKTGKVMALYSAPTYDANQFVDGISYDYWQTLTLNGDNPFINNAVSEPYPPGSTFKVVTALAALRSGIDPKKQVFCSGHYNMGGHDFKCWRTSGHGNVNMIDALTQSCNPYFYWVSQVIGINKIAETGRLLGLGDKTGIEIPGEHPGIMPDPKWKKKRFKMEWYKGDTVNVSIGQGYALTTPLQLAQMTARIASGNMVTPSIIKNQSDANKGFNLSLSQHDLDIIRKGMTGVVNDPRGTVFSKAIFFPNFVVAGKTGTAQVAAMKFKNKEKKFAHHALFTSFAPVHDPTYVVTVVIEHGEAGGKTAAPIAKEIYAKLYEMYNHMQLHPHVEVEK